jgi:hypothetical protein
MKEQYRVQFFVGLEFDRDNNRLHGKTLDMGREELLRTYDGVTTNTGHGSWLNPDTGKVVSELQVTFTVLCYQNQADVWVDVKNAAERLRELYKQSAVLVTVEPVRFVFV